MHGPKTYKKKTFKIIPTLRQFNKMHGPKESILHYILWVILGFLTRDEIMTLITVIKRL